MAGEPAGSQAGNPLRYDRRPADHTPIHTADLPDTPTRDAVRLMRQHRIGALPVVQGEHIVAMLTEEEFVGLASTALSQLPLPASQTTD